MTTTPTTADSALANLGGLLHDLVEKLHTAIHSPPELSMHPRA